MTVFKAIHIKTGKIMTVYAVHGTKFLLWDSESTFWFYEEMNHFIPWGD